MNRPILAYALLIAATGAMGAQQPSQTSPYEGTATPPPDDTIMTTAAPQAKPPAGRPITETEPQAEPMSRQDSTAPSTTYPDPDAGIAQPPRRSAAASEPELTRRPAVVDPDGDIVHPHALRPGELGEGTMIRVKLMERLSTSSSEKGQAFHSRVATDVLQGDKVLIPAGAEIDGQIVEVSSGHTGGHGSMRLRPDTVILPDGSRYRLYAQVASTPGSRTRVGGEGTIRPDSRLKRDGIEYGGAVGAGATTGAFLGGPVGALTGGLIGAGVVTAHLLVSHPQAVLETGTTLMFTLTEPLTLVRTEPNGE